MAGATLYRLSAIGWNPTPPMPLETCAQMADDLNTGGYSDEIIAYVEQSDDDGNTWKVA